MTFTDNLTVIGVEWKVSGDKPEEVSLCCPFCPNLGETVDTRFRLYINSITGRAYCFNCGWSSKGSQGFNRILRKLGAKETKEVEPEREVERSKTLKLPVDFQLLPGKKSERDYHTKQALQYLRYRGVTDNQMKDHLVGFSLTGMLSYRIIFPVYLDGSLVAMSGRDFTSKQFPKYLTAGSRSSFFNWSKERGTVHVVEGVFKALALERATGCKAVAALGSSITDAQAALLEGSSYSDCIVWADPDRPGIRGALRTLERLRDSHLRLWAAGWNGEYLDEASISEIRGMLAKNVRAYDWSCQAYMSMLSNGG